ncbi:MAG: hypothetical protein F9K43_27295 [Bauldia sp.]|nr:MAG: hypothetical protein F9K43_27295 [Bauldia sp.]
MDRLAALVEERIAGSLSTIAVTLAPEQAGEVDWLYRNGDVLRRKDREDGGVDLTVRVTEAVRREIGARFRKAAQ